MVPTTAIKLTKVQRGHYASADGRYAAVSDGYTPGYLVDPLALANGASRAEAAFGNGGEWAAVYDRRGRLRTDHNAGDNLDWFPTKRDAVAAIQQHAARGGSA